MYLSFYYLIKNKDERMFKRIYINYNLINHAHFLHICTHTYAEIQRSSDESNCSKSIIEIKCLSKTGTKDNTVLALEPRKGCI